MVAFIVGFLLIFGAAGGVEVSTTDSQLIQSALLALPGFALMCVGVSQINKG